MVNCKDCGKFTYHKDGYCTDCSFTHGEVWTFDMSLPPNQWHWQKEVR